MRSCPKCGAPAPDGERYCGIDGTPIDDPPSSERASFAACQRCGAPLDDAVKGHCSSCGLRVPSTFPSAPPSSGPASNVPLERDLPVEQDEAYGLATSVHPGMRRAQNADAAAFSGGNTRSGDPFRVLVVCDGVSSSAQADQASQIGARIVCDSLTRFSQEGEAVFDGAGAAMADAIRAAQRAICAQDIDHGAEEPPGTTCVAALVIRDRLVVGWVGDSRAYWLTARGVHLLTQDHSWANEAVATGEATLEEALRSPHAHALTRCLGPLESGETARRVEADVVVRDLAGSGVILLCSDGLWNYYPIPEQMAALVKRVGPAPAPTRLARFLVHKALARGGQDNISVAVYTHVGSAARRKATPPHGTPR